MKKSIPELQESVGELEDSAHGAISACKRLINDNMGEGEAAEVVASLDEMQDILNELREQLENYEDTADIYLDED